MKIEWTQPAVEDLESIRDYIARDSEYYAALFIEKIIATVEKLEKFPMLGKTVHVTESSNIREVFFQNYRIIYRIERSRLLVLTILHGSRDLSRIKTKPWDIN
jgi:toxin ParE1/3/4